MQSTMISGNDMSVGNTSFCSWFEDFGAVYVISISGLYVSVLCNMREVLNFMLFPIKHAGIFAVSDFDR